MEENTVCHKRASRARNLMLTFILQLRTSGIKPPAIKPFSSSINSFPALHEVSDSQSNARAQLPNTGIGGIKRNVPAPGTNNTHVFEDSTPTHNGTTAAIPEAKRKPLGVGSQYQSKAAGAKPQKGASLIDLVRRTSLNDRQITSNDPSCEQIYCGSLRCPSTASHPHHYKAKRRGASGTILE